MAFVFHNAALEAASPRRPITHPSTFAISPRLFRSPGARPLRLQPGSILPPGAALRASSGYGRVWVRDNVFVACSRLEAGQSRGRRRDRDALLTFYRKYRHRARARRRSGCRRGLATARTSDSTANPGSRNSRTRRGPTRRTTRLATACGSARRLPATECSHCESWHLEVMAALAAISPTSLLAGRGQRALGGDEEAVGVEHRRGRGRSRGMDIAPDRARPRRRRACRRPALIDTALASIANGRDALDATLPGECAQPIARSTAAMTPRCCSCSIRWTWWRAGWRMASSAMS